MAVSSSSQCANRLLSRLVGMETEYATLFLPSSDDTTRSPLPSARTVYQTLVAQIRAGQPTAIGMYDTDQVFLASGGAVSFESHPSLHDKPGGLIEIATPEVRSIHELITCQRSIDILVEDAAASANFSSPVRMLKNSSDALGHIYGCQENYETEVATGLFLVIYRLFILLLWGMQIVSLVVAIPFIITFTGIAILWQLITSGIAAFHRDVDDVFTRMPPFLIGILVHVIRLLHLPTVIVLRFVANHIAFRQQRKYLTALLVSRVVVTSTGELDEDGRFRLSAKAMAIDAVADMGGFRGERPIFVYGHWLSQLCAKSFFSLTSTRRLFGRRQRLQIGLSDSNLSDLAEYVKVGSVALVLDMIEHSETQRLPVLRRTLWSLDRINRDWNLVSSVPTSRGELSAIEIQKLYHREASRFVASVDADSRGEATQVLQHWAEALELLSAFRRDVKSIEPSLARIDWLSKLWMLNQLDENASYFVRKKVDLRYHELSEDGYHRKLSATLTGTRLVSERDIRQRRRVPPADSPAARRGWLIREFTGVDDTLRTEWTHAMVSDGNKRRRVNFESLTTPDLA